MNKYEELYDIKGNIDFQIENSKLFKLSIDDAVLNVLDKLSFLNSILNTKSDYQQKEVLRKVCNINLININVISFIQESTKWIFRWCSNFCKRTSIIDKKEIVPEDIYNLMRVAYLYEIFHGMWEMNTKRKVNYERFDKTLKFNYINEETYKVHLFYDYICRIIDEAKLQKMLDNLKVDKNNLIEAMNYAHQLDFNCTFNMEFEGFTLEDYRTFSSEVTKLFAEKTLKFHKSGVNMILPGETGLICLTKEKWIQKLSEMSKFNKEKVEKIINFFTYDFTDKSDISLTYFVPISNGRLIVADAIFNLSRPEVNAMRLLARRKSSNYDCAQNNFEEEERKKIINGINKKYLISYGKDKSKKNIPGIDLLVYDSEENYLQVIELKYKIPVDSIRDINNLDNMLEKAYKQVKEAKKYVDLKIDSILCDYFGDKYYSVIPNKIDYLVLTNYSIGTGGNNKLPTPILLINHYIELMSNKNGMELVKDVLITKDKMMNIKTLKEYISFSIFEYEIFIPQYSFKFIK
ncbi:hypothetical protein ACSW8X_00445 [Clostridium perfringens]